MSELPWTKINDFLLSSENICKPKKFCVQVIKKLYSLIPYDQARIYLVDDNRKIYDEVLIGVEQRWSDVYLEYYSNIENGQYSIFTKMKYDRFSKPKIMSCIDWTNYERDEFITDYIKPQGLSYSLGFGLHNHENFMVCVYSLDRTMRSGYTNEEISILNIIQPHLNNLFKNSLELASSNRFYKKDKKVKMPLTKRESEISELLCKGMTPINISKKLFLSLPTIYKHIANIHAKLNVSNRQELILKLINY